MLAAAALQEFEDFDSQASAKRNVTRAIERVAARLGNTRAVCRKCYVHPEVIAAYLDHELAATLKSRAESELRHSLSSLSAEEAAVVALLQGRLESELKHRQAGGKSRRPTGLPSLTATTAPAMRSLRLSRPDGAARPRLVGVAKTRLAALGSKQIPETILQPVLAECWRNPAEKGMLSARSQNFLRQRGLDLCTHLMKAEKNEKARPLDSPKKSIAVSAACHRPQRSKGRELPSGQSKERNAIMKGFLILATLVGGLTILGSTSTTSAGVYRARSTPYGYREVYCPRYGYPGPVVATPGVVYMGPPVRVAPVYAYPPPVVYGPGYAYPGFYGW